MVSDLRIFSFLVGKDLNVFARRSLLMRAESRLSDSR